MPSKYNALSVSCVFAEIDNATLLEIDDLLIVARTRRICKKLLQLMSLTCNLLIIRILPHYNTTQVQPSLYFHIIPEGTITKGSSALFYTSIYSIKIS